ncbi:MAG TPA: hypothetical protein VFP71_13145 [Candidatus Angelobacter sp.]|nr:hypothetical protein [Candidatus Angelobacter sp.]
MKSAAYLQLWHQNKLSKIEFGIRPTRAWDAANGTYAAEVKRQADLYIFALLAHQDKATLDPLDLGQWEFYVVPSAQLPDRAAITLAAVRQLCPLAVSFSELRRAVEGCAASANG